MTANAGASTLVFSVLRVIGMSSLNNSQWLCALPFSVTTHI